MKNTRFSVLLTALAAALCLSGAAVFAAPAPDLPEEPETHTSAIVLPESADTLPENGSSGDPQTWLFPLPAESGWEITKPFGEWLLFGKSRFHDGTDIAAPEDTEILAALSGTVIAAGYDYSKGIYLVVQAGEEIQYEYRHCSRLYVKVGDTVSQGDTVAVIGYTGDATGTHLHFGIRIGGADTDPMAMFLPS